MDMPPLMSNDDEHGDDDDDDGDDDARTVYCPHDRAPLALEDWESYFDAYPDALYLLASIPFHERTLDFVD